MDANKIRDAIRALVDNASNGDLKHAATWITPADGNELVISTADGAFVVTITPVK